MGLVRYEPFLGSCCRTFKATQHFFATHTSFPSFLRLFAVAIVQPILSSTATLWQISKKCFCVKSSSFEPRFRGFVTIKLPHVWVIVQVLLDDSMGKLIVYCRAVPYKKNDVSDDFCEMYSFNDYAAQDFIAGQPRGNLYVFLFRSRRMISVQFT